MIVVEFSADGSTISSRHAVPLGAQLILPIEKHADTDSWMFHLERLSSRIGGPAQCIDRIISRVSQKK